jgi:hypothetical protein
MRRNLRFVAVLAAALASSASAQISTEFLDRWDLAYRFDRNSARLDGLAGMWVAVEDESREINMWDYGENVAGFLLDRDEWTGDFWLRVASRDRRLDGRSYSGSIGESGVRVSFRSYERALGLEGNLTAGDDSQGSSGEKHAFSGPRVAIVGNQSIGERIFLGAAFTHVNEDEKLTRANPLEAEHHTRRTDFHFGAFYYLMDLVDVGVTAQFARNRIEGVSEDGQHRDTFDWDRPVTRLGFQAILSGQDALKGGVYLRRTLLDGGEELEISWSREFFINPSGVDLTLTVPTLTEELKSMEYGTRWLYAPSPALALGVDASYEGGSYESEASPTFPAFVTTTDLDFTATGLGVGASVSPVEDLMVAGQFDVSTREIDSVVLASGQNETSSDAAARAGAEYFVRPYLALRGGLAFHLLKYDLKFLSERESRDWRSLAWAAGVGWAPRGGFLLLDFALGHTSRNLTEPDGLEDETGGFDVTITGRAFFR